MLALGDEGRLTEAEAEFENALAMAREAQCRLLELRAALSCFRFRQRRGDGYGDGQYWRKSRSASLREPRRRCCLRRGPRWRGADAKKTRAAPDGDRKISYTSLIFPGAVVDHVLNRRTQRQHMSMRSEIVASMVAALIFVAVHVASAASRLRVPAGRTRCRRAVGCGYRIGRRCLPGLRWRFSFHRVHA